MTKETQEVLEKLRRDIQLEMAHYPVGDDVTSGMFAIAEIDKLIEGE